MLIKMLSSLNLKYIVFTIILNERFIIAFIKNLSPEESLKEDMLLDTMEIMTKYGYKAEKHSVTTEDGFILDLHRMLPKNNNLSRKHPVFVMHGLGSSSFDWLVLGPQKSIVHLLHDEGYDVWLGNCRGNIYARDHVSLNPNEPKFWKFSWHEIGYYDLPASINYVLEKTNSSQLHYTGHSQGTTSFFVMCSMKPEYNDKIRSFNALAPPVFMSNAEFVGKYAAIFHRQLLSLIETKDLYEIPPNRRMTTLATYYLCKVDGILSLLCEDSIYLLGGVNEALLNKTLLPLMLSHMPAGGSILQIVHYFQEMMSGKFRQFDHGTEGNKMLYGTSEPPDYPLQNVRAPVALHWSDNDVMVAPEDVYKLKKILSNVILCRKVPFTGFNHIDYVFAIDAKKYIYDSVIDVINKRD